MLSGKVLVAAQGAAATVCLPCAGMLDPEVQLVLDTMMRVAFPGHTEFATSKLARELAKQIMEQVKSPRWVQQTTWAPCMMPILAAGSQG